LIFGLGLPEQALPNNYTRAMKEVSVVKRKWSENPKLPFSPLKVWGKKIKMAVSSLLS
jgi:hypothetical protein